VQQYETGQTSTEAFMKLSLRKIMNAGFSAALAILAAISFFSYRHINKLVEDCHQVEHTHEVLEQLKDIIATMKDIETGTRGYVITGKGTFLEPYYSAIKIIEQNVSTLRTLTTDNPDQQSRLNAIRLKITENITHSDEVVNLRKNKGFAAAARLTRSGKGKQVMDDIRRLVAEMENEENILLIQRTEKAKTSSKKISLIIIIGSTISFIMVAMTSIVINRDLRERKRVNDALRDNEGRIRAILNTTVDGFITINEHGIVESFNPSAERIFGYNRDEVIGNNVNMLMPEPYHSEHHRYLENYLKTGVRKVIGIGREVVGKRKDGTTFPVDLAVSEVHLDNRRIFTGIIRDITLRKLAEEEIRKLSRAVEQSPVAVIITNFQGNIEYVNPRFTQITGYTSPEVVGQNPRMLKSGETSPEVYKHLWETITSGKEWKGEFHNKKKIGELYWAHASISPVNYENGKTSNFIAIEEDITERKQMMEALKYSEEQFRLLLNSTAEAIYGIDTQGNCTFCNPVCVKMLGYSSPDQLIGKNMHKLIHHTRVDGSPYPVEECHIYQAFHTGEGSHEDTEVRHILWKNVIFTRHFIQERAAMKIRKSSGEPMVRHFQPNTGHIRS